MEKQIEIKELQEIIMFGAGCFDIHNCNADLEAVETYCKGGGNSDGPYAECGVKASCK